MLGDKSRLTSRHRFNSCAWDAILRNGFEGVWGGGFLDVPALFLGQDDDDDVEDGKRGKGSG